jgi:hypothetical protein
MLQVDLLLQSATAEGVSLLMVLTTKFRPSKPRVREEYITSFMHIFYINKVPRVVLQSLYNGTHLGGNGTNVPHEPGVDEVYAYQVSLGLASG